MNNEIRQDLLHIDEKGQELYNDFRNARIVNKTERISQPIHLNKIKNFNAIHSVNTMSTLALGNRNLKLKVNVL